MPNSTLSRASVKRQRITLAIIVALLGGLVSVYNLLDFRHVREHEEDKLVTQAELVSTNIELHITSADRVLDEILALLDMSNPGQQQDPMQSLVNAMPIIRAIGILDRDGRQVAGTRYLNNGRDFSHRPYFRNAQADPQRQKLYISTPYQTLSGDISLSLGKAIIDRSGDFQGIVYASFEPEYIRTLMMSTLYTPDMWAALIHIDGDAALQVRGNVPDANQIAISHETLQRLLPSRAHNEDFTVIRADMPGDPQLVAASVAASHPGIAHHPLWVVTGRDYHAALTSWRHLAYVQAGLFGLFTGVTTAGLLLYQRRRRQYDARAAADRRLMRAREQDYRIIVENTATCIIKLDPRGEYSYVNPAFSTYFGVTATQAVGSRFFDLMADDESRQKAQQCIAAAFTRPSSQGFRAICRTPQGPMHLEWAIFPITADDSKVNNVIGIGHDVSEHIIMHDKLQQLAQNDGLTGLPNHRHFKEIATIELSASHRYDRPLSILLIDLDHFKSVNDTRGHQSGDIALQTCARTIRESCREFDTPARIGGEEFCVLLPSTATEDALGVAERLRLAIAAEPVLLPGGDNFGLTASIGLATRQPDEKLEDLMERADAALYTAKRNGRNRVEISDGTLPAQD